MPRCRRAGLLPTVLLTLLPGPMAAQDRQGPGEVEPYFRALGEHFRVSRAEVDVLAAWGLPPDHLPVVLFMAHRSGVSPDALISQKRSGSSWARVAEGLGLDASVFHVLVPRDAPLGRLAHTYERFARTPPSQWSSIELSDAEIVALANVRFIGSALGVPPVRVVEATTGAASFVAVYNRLGSSR